MPAQLDHLATQLASETREMEPDFVRLADGLTTLHQEAAGLNRLASDLIDAVRTTLAQSRLAGENGLVTTALGELQAALDDSSRRLAALATMTGTLGQLREQGGIIERIATMLKASGCNFAVESARTTECQQAFSDFVQHLRQLAQKIGTLGETIAVEAHAARLEQHQLIQSTTAGLAELQQLTAHSATAVATASERIQGVLDTAAGVVFLAEERARTIKRHSEAAVYFLQFGDIVRQKLEHVAQALASVQAGACTAAAAPAAASASSAPPATAEVAVAPALDVLALDRLLAIQAGQLETIRADALTARTQLAAAFTGFAGETSQLVADITSLAQPGEAGTGASALDQAGAFAELTASIRQLQTLLSRGHELGAQSQRTALRAADVSAQLTRHLDEVEEVNCELHLQALNAIVKTAWLGPAGATLGVLSAHVHEVSRDSNDCVATILPLLEQIRTCTTSLDGATAPGAATDPTTPAVSAPAALERGLENIAGLHDRFHQTSLSAASLATRQAASLAQASGHLDLLTALADRMSALQDAITAARACLAPSVAAVGPASAQDHAALLASYTMESEREVHRRVLGQPAIAATAFAATGLLASDATASSSEATVVTTAPTTPPDAAADLGDNVELF